jgi:predicted DNA-binding protein
VGGTYTHLHQLCVAARRAAAIRSLLPEEVACTTVWCMKTEVYSWRLKSERKAALEDIARKRSRAVSELLDEAVDLWLSEQADLENEEALQQKLRQAAAPVIGSIAGGDPERAEQSRARLRAKLAARQKKRS